MERAAVEAFNAEPACCRLTRKTREILHVECSR